MTEFMTVEEVAKIFRMSTRRVQVLAQAGELASVKPFRRLLIKKDSVAQKLGVRPEELC